jgi:hypothetical protein
MPKPAVRDTGGRADVDRCPSLKHFIDDRVRRGHADLSWPAGLAERFLDERLNPSDEAGSRTAGAPRSTRTEAGNHLDAYQDPHNALSHCY